jgi:hypothetical protein
MGKILLGLDVKTKGLDKVGETDGDEVVTVMTN